MSSGAFRCMMHDFMPGFLMIAVAELLELGFAALVRAARAAIVIGF